MGSAKRTRARTDWQARMADAGRFDLTASLQLREGDRRDYHRLSQHHYRAPQPATATRVLVLESTAPSLRTRLGGEPDPPAIAAVLVESLPSLSCQMRDYATHERYGGLKNTRQRAMLLNAELRCISRVVVHPQWRGLGLAVQLVRHALATATTPMTEALAAMGRINPFFARAGMTAYPRPPHACDDRLIAAMARLGLSPQDLSLLERVHSRLDRATSVERDWFHAELRRWFARNGGRRHLKNPTAADLLAAARDRLLLQPVYYLWR